jgi:hypothetical protein
MHETYTLGLNPTSPKGVGGFPPRGECVVREGGSCDSRACVSAVRGGAAYSRAILDAVDEKKMMQSFENVQVELYYDACGAESYFGDEFVRGHCRG